MSEFLMDPKDMVMVLRGADRPELDGTRLERATVHVEVLLHRAPMDSGESVTFSGDVVLSAKELETLKGLMVKLHAIAAAQG